MLIRASLIVVLIYQFHILRNLSPLYFIILFSCLLVFCVFFIVNSQKIRYNTLILVFIVSFFWIYATFVSLLSSGSHGSPIIGIARLWATFPIVIVALVLSRVSIKSTMMVISLFFTLAVFSYFWQLVYGPVTWFAEASERAGGIRFASLIGSLTAYGIFVGIPALAALCYFNRGIGLLIFSLLTIGAAISLQKAALANIAIALIFALWIGAISTKILIFGVSLGVASLFFLLSLDPQNNSTAVVFQFFIGVITGNAYLTADVGFFYSMVSRLVSLPLEAISFFGFSALVAGVGVFGGSGVFGYPEIPMAHNGLVEIILVFGFFIGGVICFGLIGLFIFSILKLLKRKNVMYSESGFLYCAYIIWIIPRFGQPLGVREGCGSIKVRNLDFWAEFV